MQHRTFFFFFFPYLIFLTVVGCWIRILAVPLHSCFEDFFLIAEKDHCKEARYVPAQLSIQNAVVQ